MMDHDDQVDGADSDSIDDGDHVDDDADVDNTLRYQMVVRRFRYQVALSDDDE